MSQLAEDKLRLDEAIEKSKAAGYAWTKGTRKNGRKLSWRVPMANDSGTQVCIWVVMGGHFIVATTPEDPSTRFSDRNVTVALKHAEELAGTPGS